MPEHTAAVSSAPHQPPSTRRRPATAASGVTPAQHESLADHTNRSSLRQGAAASPAAAGLHRRNMERQQQQHETCHADAAARRPEPSTPKTVRQAPPTTAPPAAAAAAAAVAATTSPPRPATAALPRRRSASTPTPTPSCKVPKRALQLLSHAGLSLAGEERRRYLLTGGAIGKGSFGCVREAHRHLTGSADAKESANSTSASNVFSTPAGPSYVRARSTTNPRISFEGGEMQVPFSPDQDTLSLSQIEGRRDRRSYIRVAVKEIDLTKILDENKLLRIVTSAIREARLLRRVRGAPHLIQSFRPWYNAWRGRLCFPMEMADMNLDRYIYQMWDGAPPAGFLLSLAKQMLLSLEELHERRIVHRDVKLENFLVFISDHQGVPPTIKLADFGLSATEEDEGHSEDILGTPFFMAPECFQARANAPGSPVVYGRDVWAVGCMLFIMAHDGAVPFDADDSRDLRRRIAGRRLSVGAPAAGRIEMEVLHQLALRCLEVDTTRRPTVSQVLQELNAKLELLRLSPLNQQLAVQRRPKIYQLMRLCRPDHFVSVFPEIPRGDETASAANVLRCGEYLLMEEELYVKARRDADKRRGSSVKRWAKIVYPVRGFCRSEENGHHVFHPYHYSEETCPRLGGKLVTEAHETHAAAEQTAGGGTYETAADVTR